VVDQEDFERAISPHRRELMAHCYRMLGSTDDAEDLVQETFLRAWRSYHTFDGQRATLRTWLYRIATNACLSALERRKRRPLPAGLSSASDDPRASLESDSDIPWLQPIPDTLFDEADWKDPSKIVAARSSVRLAFIAALQHLPARQRAVLILRDVVALRAAEVATVLGISTAAVTSSLQRAREQLRKVAPVEDEVVEPAEPGHRELLEQYVMAFENSDIDGLLGLLRDDITFEMPPYLTWFAGHRPVSAFISSHVLANRGVWRVIATRANGQPAAATFLHGRDGDYHAHSIQVLTIVDQQVSRIVAFQNPRLFEAFGLPRTLPAAGGRN
jgi:RNA polymerase sigma-70 factor (ECF subfamily)